VEAVGKSVLDARHMAVISYENNSIQFRSADRSS